MKKKRHYTLMCFERRFLFLNNCFLCIIPQVQLHFEYAIDYNQGGIVFYHCLSVCISICWAKQCAVCVINFSNSLQPIHLKLCTCVIDYIDILERCMGFLPQVQKRILDKVMACLQLFFIIPEKCKVFSHLPF